MNSNCQTAEEPWDASLQSLTSLPAEIAGEISEAWEALVAYEIELSTWHEQLENFRAELVSFSGQRRGTPLAPEAVESATAGPQAPPVAGTNSVDATRHVSAAARQFAALHRQRSARRGQ